MDLSDILERASDEEYRFNVGDSIFKKLLPEAGYQLWLGEKYGVSRNQFWYDALNDAVFVDCFQNILHIVGNYVSTLQNLTEIRTPKSIENRREINRQLIDVVRELNQYLKEHLEVSLVKKINENDSVLGIPNREVLEDIRRMRKLVSHLNTFAPGTSRYRRIAQIFINFYKGEVKDRYMKYASIESMNNPTSPPPSQ